MKVIYTLKKAISVYVILFFLPFILKAQNLPSSQPGSVQAPVNIKIDGKTNEWNDRFQAYNKSTRIYYTISNDNTNLYLTVKADDFITIKKIVLGGITFTLNKSNKKSDTSTVAVTFPIYDKDQEPLVLSDKMRSENKNEVKSQIDSFVNLYNRQIPIAMKLIGVKGIRNINERYISIYNEYNIKAVALFNKEMHYTYELAIPFKLIDLNSAEISKINYSLQLNGQQTVKGYPVTSAPGRSNLFMYVDGKGQMNMLDNSPGNMEIYYPTNFSGEYILWK